MYKVSNLEMAYLLLFCNLVYTNTLGNLTSLIESSSVLWETTWKGTQLNCPGMARRAENDCSHLVLSDYKIVSR